ncbi:hypothetical protein C8D87_10978 [Lentzea atacamensis]|uniref:Uncharacterized protein n=1 Tax=Lentzea atacamensis TaxID=531938 RepID=A0ABX9E0F2_9PSEU|nr:hypothetical protein [Lentzea atacamensis]RAS61635.1 hypothetical protein C8D87_10978 [Lentzea atacamensis]
MDGVDEPVPVPQPDGPLLAGHHLDRLAGGRGAAHEADELPEPVVAAPRAIAAGATLSIFIPVHGR